MPSTGLLRVFHDFDSVHKGHALDWNESEEDFALRGRPDAGKAPLQGQAFSAGLLEDIEIP